MHPGEELCLPRGAPDFLTQTKVSSGLALALLPLYSYKAFTHGISLDALNNHRQYGKGWVSCGPEKFSDLLRVTWQVSDRAKISVLCFPPRVMLAGVEGAECADAAGSPCPAAHLTANELLIQFSR